MYYIVDIPTCNRLGLQGAEVLVFSCLAYLCRDKGYWNGNYTKLAEYSLCGGRDTARRTCEKLALNDCIIIRGTRFSIGAQNAQSSAQNAQSGAQNEQLSAQNAQFSEKEKYPKEKEIIKEKRGSNNIEPSPEDFLGSVYSPCTKVEAALFGQQNGIPVEVVGKWWYHFEERGWKNSDGTKIHNWQSSLQKWFLREKQMNMLFITGCPSRDSYNGCPSRGKPTEGAVDRNEQIRQEELRRQNEEREKAEKDAVPMPENMRHRFANFGKG